MRRFLTLMAILALMAAACGGGPGGESDTGGDDQPDTGEVASEDTDGDGGGGGGILGAGGFCGEVIQAVARFEGSGDPDPTVTLEDDMQESLSVLDELADDAPSEIRGDMQIIVEGWRAFLETEPGEMPDYDEEALDAASDRIDAYLVRECGFEPDEDDEQFDEVDAGPLEDQTVTLGLTGSMSAEETFTGLDVDCTHWDDGEVWVTAYGQDDQWSIEVNATGPSDLSSGSYPAYNVVAVPPYESVMGQSGDSLLAEEGMLHIHQVGEREDLGDGVILAEITGTYEATLVSTVDGSEVEASGTFSCPAYVIEP